MTIHYLARRGSLRKLVLTRDGHWVELHVKAVGEDVWSLLTLTGEVGGQPARNRCQGPFASPTAAEAALRNLTSALMTEGFAVPGMTGPVWSLQAQRLARHIRQDRDANAGNYPFDPGSPLPI